MKCKSVFFIFFIASLLFSQNESYFPRNLGKFVNTPKDEFPIDFDGQNLIFLQKEGNNQTLCICLITDSNFFVSKGKYLLPKEFNKYQIHSLSFFNAPNRKEIVFSANLPKKYDSDLFLAEFDYRTGKFIINPFPFNTKDFESHPRFSSDGSFLVFVSDRAGSTGGTDLMLSFRKYENAEFGWTKPIFLDSNINTNENEITPYLDNGDNLYFSRSVQGNYEVFRAKSLGKAKWAPPVKVSLINNPQSNEIFPVVAGDKLFFASDQNGSNGGYDLWSFDLCLPVLLEVNFTEHTSIFSSYNKLVVQEENGQLVAEKYIGSETELLFPLLPRKTYYISIANECNQQRYFEQKVSTFCSDSAIVKYRISINISNEITKDFQVPFFVTGYYKPNTSANLNALRKLFQYKLIGYDDSTRFVEIPSGIYDTLAIEVDSAMISIIKSIKYFLALFQKNCLPSNKLLLVQVTGYSDPRGISENARFFEETIDDFKMNTFIRRGSKIDNFLLSKLRAYFTAKLIENELSKDFAGEYDTSRLLWEIRGGGEALPTTDDNFLHLRKVRVVLNIVDY